MRIGYCSVSTIHQNSSRQEEALISLGVERLFIDKCSGKDTERPALKEMLNFARKGDTIIVSEISRIARNTKDLLQIIEILSQKEVEFVSQKEAIDTSTPTGKFILTIFGAISELEREYILSRQAEGIAIAKANGVYKGRKRKECPDFEKLYSQVQRKAISATQAWTILGISKSSWYKRVREKQQEQPKPQH